MTSPRQPEASRRRWSTVTFWLVVTGLLILHVWPVGDPLGREGNHPGLLGPIPWDLAYPLLWMAAAWAAITFLVRRVWTDPTSGDEGAQNDDWGANAP